MRKYDYSSILDKYVTLDGSLTTRDKTSIRKSFSGLVKLIYPHQELTEKEVLELLDFSVEGRKRVKDQLYIIDETFRSEPVDFKYTILSNGVEVYPETLENLNYSAEIEVMEETEAEDSGKVFVKPKLELKPHQTILKDNQTGISYKKLFANYLKGAENITIQDPYIRMYYQFKNLLEFCIMLGNNKDPEDQINLELVTWNHEEYIEESRVSLEELAQNVESIGINLTVRFENHHDRFIAADNGWKITLGRGLDIFEKIEERFSVADMDQTKRKCKSCEMTYLRL
jgi:ATP-dependent Lon protease